MNIFDTTVLGIVEGITEFLPISSTGHLILAGHLLGADGDTEKSFEVFIQLGAILAVVFLYSHRFHRLFDFKEKKGFAGMQGWILLFITSLPAVILGKLFHHAIKEHLFSTMTVAWALGIGGLAIILVEQLRFKPTTHGLDGVTRRQALMVGCFQCLALWPGVSRAAATIIGGLFAGLDRKIAAEYSFIAAVPIMIAATTLDLVESLHSLHMSDLAFFAMGFVIAFVAAIFAIKFFIHLLQRTSLTPFGIYRIAIAILFIWVLH